MNSQKLITTTDSLIIQCPPLCKAWAKCCNAMMYDLTGSYNEEIGLPDWPIDQDFEFEED